MRTRLPWLTLPALAVTLTACGSQPAAPAPTVIVNTPSSDGSLVLVAVLVMGLVVSVAGCVALAFLWRGEKTRRTDTERTLELSTGLPISRLRIDMARAPGTRPSDDAVLRALEAPQAHHPSPRQLPS